MDKNKLLLDAKEAAALCNVSQATWYRLHIIGKTPEPVKLGRRSLWVRDELEAWVRAGCPKREKWNKLKRKAELT